MKIQKTLARGARAFLRPKKWSSYDYYKHKTVQIIELAKPFFVFKKPPILKETYQESVQRQNLTQEHLRTRKIQFLVMAYLFFVAFLGLSFYAVIRLYLGHFFAAFFSTIVALIALVEAYRNHLWYTQMKHEILGLNFSKWCTLFFKGKSK